LELSYRGIPLFRDNMDGVGTQNTKL
jgi:hypothetical protein